LSQGGFGEREEELGIRSLVGGLKTRENMAQAIEQALH